MLNSLANLLNIINHGTFLKYGYEYSPDIGKIPDSKIPKAIQEIRKVILAAGLNNPNWLGVLSPDKMKATLAEIQKIAATALERSSLGRKNTTRAFYTLLRDTKLEDLSQFLKNKDLANAIEFVTGTLDTNTVASKADLAKVLYEIASTLNSDILKQYIHLASGIPCPSIDHAPALPAKTDKPAPAAKPISATATVLQTVTRAGEGIDRLKQTERASEGMLAGSKSFSALATALLDGQRQATSTHRPSAP
jgi:hypothetical protein